MKQPKIELRKISHNKRLSEETPAYTAELWADGVLIAYVGNHGTGGCDHFHPAKGKSYDEVRALNDRVKATYPKRSYDFGGDAKGEFETDIEYLCHMLVDRHCLEKAIRRDLSKKVMFVKPSDGKLYGIKVLAPANRPKVVELVKKTHGVARTLNEMTMDEAIAIYEAV